MADGDERRPLIEPPPGLLPPAKPRPEADVAVNTGSSTRKIRPTDVPAFRPAPPPPPGGRPAAPEPDRTAAMTGTVVVWNLQTPDGSWHEVGEHGTVVGRNPTPPAGHPDAETLAVDDPGRSVSKTHALFSMSDDALAVEDLSSTNGVTVTEHDGAAVRLPAGEPVAVADGAVVALGSLPFRVRRGRRLG